MGRRALDEFERAESARRHRDKMAEKSRDDFEAVAEIGAIRAVADPARRERGRLDLHYFLTTYFPGTTGKSPFSDDHKRVIARMQEAALKGGRYFNLVFRGFAKTTISVNTCLWALLYGHRKLVVLIGANRNAAKDLLDAIKAELETNELLAADFPEVVQAIEALEGKVQRCQSQTCGGELTHIEWTKEKVVFPSIAGSIASGATVVTRGITSSIRGIGQRRVDGTQQRPDFVICDDLQTDQSAASEAQVSKRLMTLGKSILKLAGHNSTIACVVNGTIIQPDDLMDRLRDPAQYPGWQGETVKMVREFSDNHEQMWMGEYARLRKSFDPAMPGDQDRAHREANEYYRANRAAMDAGCQVSWEHCFDPDNEISAIQHAYNFLIDDGDEVFNAECQSSPRKQDSEEKTLQTADVLLKLSGLGHRVVPNNVMRIVGHIDVQDESLWYTIVAWTADFTGYVIDYGIFPDQRSLEVTKNRLRVSLSKKYPKLKDPAVRTRQGLSDLCDELLQRRWLDPSGHEHQIDKLGVDVADGEVAISLRSWIKSSKWSTHLVAMRGMALRPADEPLGDRKKSDDEKRRGLNWVEKRDKKVRGGSVVSVDVNWWKTFVANRWRAASPRPNGVGKDWIEKESGALYLWGDDQHVHRSFAAQQCSESATTLKHEKSGRMMDFWQEKANSGGNEWWDNIVAASALGDYVGGVTLRDAGLSTAPRKRKRLTAADIRALQEAKNNA